MTKDWIKIADVADVPEEGTLLRKVEGQAICLYNVDGEIFATADTCSHADASLADGFIVDKDQIECPLHGGRFHIPTGKAVLAPCTLDIKSYSVQIDGTDVMIDRAEVVAESQ